MEKKIEKLNLQKKVFLPGYTTDIYEKVKKSKIFVSSSDYEGMSNSMLEALSLGLPTICTDCPIGGAGEIIQNGINGILVPVNDLKEMVAAMKRGSRMVVHGVSSRGTNTKDTYSLNGFASAYRAISNKCKVK